jgi:hypothetical protein
MSNGTVKESAADLVTHQGSDDVRYVEVQGGRVASFVAEHLDV